MKILNKVLEAHFFNVFVPKGSWFLLLSISWTSENLWRGPSWMLFQGFCTLGPYRSIALGLWPLSFLFFIVIHLHVSSVCPSLNQDHQPAVEYFKHKIHCSEYIESICFILMGFDLWLYQCTIINQLSVWLQYHTEGKICHW